MSVETDGAAQEFTPEPAATLQDAPATPGELLKAARTGRNLSIQQIADDLHLDVRVVAAIESNNFAVLGPPVYSRGHLRKYATIVGLAPEVVISHYELLTDVPVAPAPIPASVVSAPPLEPKSLRKPLLVVAGIAAAAILVWVAVTVVNRLDSNATSVPVAEVVSAAPEAVEPSVATEQAPVETEPQAATPPPVTRSVVAESSVANTGNDVTMRLRFSEPSWVEIYDATNRRLMFGIGQAGQASTLAGQPPLRVTLGMASAVAMEVNGRAVPVPRRAGKDAAKFTVVADGSVR